MARSNYSILDRDELARRREAKEIRLATDRGAEQDLAPALDASVLMLLVERVLLLEADVKELKARVGTS